MKSILLSSPHTDEWLGDGGGGLYADWWRIIQYDDCFCIKISVGSITNNVGLCSLEDSRSKEKSTPISDIVLSFTSDKLI